MARIDGLRPIDAYYLACNYNQGLLATLHSGGDAEGAITPFKHTNDKSKSTDLHDVFFNLVVEDYADARFGTYEAHNVSINYRLREQQIDEIEARGKEIDEVVLYYNTDQLTTYIDTFKSYDDVASKDFYGFDAGNRIGYFGAYIKFKDGSTDWYSINWGLDLITATYSNYQYGDRRYVDGFPVSFNDDGSVFSIYGWNNGNNDSKGSVRGLYGFDFQHTKFRFSHKLFANKADALTYLKYGIDNSLDEDGGGDEEPAEDRIQELYYLDTVYKNTVGQNNPTSAFSHSVVFRVQFATNSGQPIGDTRRAIVGYVDSLNASTFSNIQWVYAEDTKVVDAKYSYKQTGGTKHESTYPPTLPTKIGFYDRVTVSGYEYNAQFRTNMMIFANRDDALDWLNGGNARPLFDGSQGRLPSKGTGDEYVYNTQTEGGAHSSMSECWLMTQEQLDNLASIFTTNLTLSEAQNTDVGFKAWTSFIRGLDMYNNPIDVVCDLFWLPIDISQYAIFSGRNSWDVSGEENAVAFSGVWANPSGENKLFNLHPNYGQGTLYEALKAEADAKVEQLNDQLEQGGVVITNRRTGEQETVPLIIEERNR